MLQQPGVIAKELRPHVSDRLYGCDDCLDACPPGSRILETATGRAGRHEVMAVLGASDEELLDRFGHFYLPKRRPSMLRRNALVVLGNVGGPDATAVAAGYLGHHDWVLRAHAAWAVGELRDPEALDVLEAAARGEDHPAVLDEIEDARFVALTDPPGGLR